MPARIHPSLPFLAALLAMVMAVPARGQNEVEFKVLCFPKQAEISTIEMLVGKEEVIEVNLQSHEFTLPQKAPRLAEWQFGKSGIDAEGKFSFTTQARVTPLPSGRQLLLFVRKGRSNEDGFKVTPVNPDKLRGKHYMVLNLTAGPINGMVGGQKFKLPPGRRVILKPDADRGDDLCFASLHYVRDGNWRSFFSSNWRLRKQSRVLIFVYNVSGQRSPRIHSVIDPL